MSIDLTNVRAAEVEQGWEIQVGGRPIKTPAKAPLVVPSAALAFALAAEWRAQKGRLNTHAMPLTRLAMTVIDRIRPDPVVAIDQVIAYAGTDLLCYRAEEPEALVRRQSERWQPWLDWVVRHFDAHLRITHGVVPVAQDPDAIAALRRAVTGLDPHALMVLAEITALSGSCVLGLAAIMGKLDAKALFDLCQLDEDFQIERWGEDAEAAKRRAGLLADLTDSLRYLALVRGDQAASA